MLGGNLDSRRPRRTLVTLQRLSPLPKLSLRMTLDSGPAAGPMVVGESILRGGERAYASQACRGGQSREQLRSQMKLLDLDVSNSHGLQTLDKKAQLERDCSRHAMLP